MSNNILGIAIEDEKIVIWLILKLIQELKPISTVVISNRILIVMSRQKKWMTKYCHFFLLLRNTYYVNYIHLPLSVLFWFSYYFL